MVVYRWIVSHGNYNLQMYNLPVYGQKWEFIGVWSYIVVNLQVYVTQS